MSNHSIALPNGWYRSDQATQLSLMNELRKEMVPGHLLYGVNITIIADRRGGTDDILVTHVDDPARFTVVHLTWVGKPEIDPNFPAIECDGSFSDFLEYERAFNLGFGG